MTKFFNSYKKAVPAAPDEYTLGILEVMPEAVPVSDIIRQFKGAREGSAAKKLLRRSLVNVTSEQVVRELEKQYG